VTSPAHRYRRLRDLVHAAASRPEAERVAWLRAEAADDPALCAEALRLLAEDGAPTGGLLLGDVAPPPAPPWSLPPGTRLGPYLLGTELGRGGMGVVHEAQGGGHAESVAIKVILPHLLGSEGARERFRREARLGLAIEHRNVVRALDVGEAEVGGQRFAYLVMERVRGRTFRQLLQAEGALPEAWVRELVAQAAEGLAALHASGVVHRDLKPENLILTDDRRVRVMDLGVAKSGGSHAGLTAEGIFLGSPSYAAPEQCQGRAVGPGADLYALGVVLYELASGRPPFEAREPLALLRAHVDETPEPLETLSPTVSPFLAAVAGTLLAKRSEQRFASAAALAQTLHEGEGGAWWQARRLDHPAGHRRAGEARHLPLVARERELASLRAAWKAAQGGRGGLILLEAEAGLGASRLLAEVLDEARRAGGATVLHAECGDATQAPGPLESFLPRLGTGPLASTLATRLALAPEVAETLAAQLAHLPLRAGRAPLPRASVEGFLARLVRQVAGDAPMLWVVEDLQQASPEQVRTILTLARTASSLPLLLVVSAQPDLDPAVRARLTALPAAQTLALARLTHEELVRLFEAAVGDPGMARRLARVLGPRADGVPLFALEMLRDIERRGASASDPWSEELTREGTPPRALRDLVLARLREVPEGLRGVLEAAAVVGREVDPALLATALGRPRVEVLEALGQLERRYALLRSGPRLFRFDLALVREAVQAEVPLALQADIHDRLADALALSPDLPDGERAARVAEHRLCGARPQSARDTLAPALAHLAQSGRTPERIALLGRALQVPGLFDDAGRFDRLLDLALDQARRGLHEVEARTLAEAEALARALGDRRRQGLAALQRGYLLMRTGGFEMLVEEARRMRPLCAGDPKLESECAGLEGKALWCLGRYDEARARHEEALAIAAAAPSELPRARVRADLAIVLQEQGHLAEALAHQEEALAVLRRASDRRNVSSAIGDTANTLLAMGRVSDALPLFTEALAIARHDGLLGNEATLLINLGELYTRVGQLELAREHLEGCLGLTQETGERRVEGYALHGLGRVEAWQGASEAARRHFEAALALRRSMGTGATLAETLLELGQCELDAGAEAAARKHLEEALQVARAVGEPNVVVLGHATLARVAPEHLALAHTQRDASVGRLRVEARLEVASLLWQATRDPAELREAQALLTGLLVGVPEAWRASLRARVPYVAALPTTGGTHAAAHP
jgi:tetratricopeptide (TPR) repeat protein